MGRDNAYQMEEILQAKSLCHFPGVGQTTPQLGEELKAKKSKSGRNHEGKFYQRKQLFLKIRCFHCIFLGWFGY